MKVCFVADNVSPSAGLGRMITNIAESLKKKGIESDFVVKNNFKELSSNEIPIPGFKNPALLPLDLYRLRNLLVKYDAVFAFDVRPFGIYAHLALLFSNTKLFIHCLGTYSLFERKNPIKNFLSRSALRGSKVFIIGEFVRRKIEESSESKFCFKNKYKIVPVGVDVEKFTITDKRPDMVNGPYILSVGEAKKRKNQLSLIQAFSQLVKKNSDFETKLVIVSKIDQSNKYHKKLIGFVNSNKLEERVLFVSGITDEELTRLYSHCLFFALTPISTPDFIEGFGMVYLEAALFKKASLGTLDSGAEEAIVNNQTGILVNNSTDKIAEGLQCLLSEKQKRDNMGKAARARAKEFCWENVAEDYYREMLGVMSKTA